MIVLFEIQKRLANAIKTCGLSQTKIAKELNISQSAIAHYIKGDIMPALDTFANLCVVIDIDPADILGTNSFNNSGSISFKG